MNNYHDENEFVLGRVIVAFGEDSTFLKKLIHFDKNLVANGIEIVGVEILHHPHSLQDSNTYSKNSDHNIALIKIKSKKKEAVVEAIDILRQNPNVLYAEPDWLMHLDRIPNDPHFRSLWGLQKIKAPSAWSRLTGNPSVVVGVIDSGINYYHEDLRNNILITKYFDQHEEGICGWDFVHDDYDPLDKNGHGTHVAGIIGAAGNNGIGIVGVNWDIKMVALKISASGTICTSAAIKAVEYAIDKEIPILNNSWGGRIYSESLKTTIEQYHGLFIASAGNSSLDNDIYPHYPASYECNNIISVAATDHDDNLTSFSNYGSSTADIAAPGAEIYSCLLGNEYGFWSGTSMAAPHVAGAAALLKGYRPELSALEIKSIILSSADKIPSLSGKVLTGGRLNVNAMLNMADSTVHYVMKHPAIDDKIFSNYRKS